MFFLEVIDCTVVLGLIHSFISSLLHNNNNYNPHANIKGGKLMADTCLDLEFIQEYTRNLHD